MVRESEKYARFDKVTRHMIKQMLYNYERTGFDVNKTIQLEIVKIELSRLAREHHRKILLTKGIKALI